MKWNVITAAILKVLDVVYAILFLFLRYNNQKQKKQMISKKQKKKRIKNNDF